METPGGRLREIGLATSKLDDDVKISVVLREAPTKFRDNLLVNSQQFESNKNKLQAIIQAYLKSNKSWIASDFKHDTKESDPMGVDHISKGKGKSNGKGNGKSKGKVTKPDNQDTRVLRVRKERAIRARLLVTSKPRQNS